MSAAAGHLAGVPDLPQSLLIPAFSDASVVRALANVRPRRQVRAIPVIPTPLIEALMRQIHMMFAALASYTRLTSFDALASSVRDEGRIIRYLPVAGWAVGAMSSGLFLLTSHLFPFAVSVLLAMAGGMFLSGATHELGLARSIARRFTPLAGDVSVSSGNQTSYGFGAITTLLAILLRFAALSYLSSTIVVAALFCVPPLSRLAALLWLRQLPDGDDPQNLRLTDYLGAVLTGLVPLALVLSFARHAPVLREPLLLASAFAFAGAMLFAFMVRKHRDASDWDDLSGAQQAAETTFCLVIVAAGT